MPEKLNFNVGIPNSGIDAYGRKRQPYAKPLRLYDVVESIRSNPRLEGWLKEELIKKDENQLFFRPQLLKQSPFVMYKYISLDGILKKCFVQQNNILAYKNALQEKWKLKKATLLRYF